MFGVILLTSRPKALAAALAAAHQALKNGELVCVFPEGDITRTGQMQAFKPGMLKILRGTDVPVIPVYLDELWGSIFSLESGKLFWKWPRRWRYPISIHFGRAVSDPHDVYQVRRAVQDLGTKAVERRTRRMGGLGSSFIRVCKRRKWRSKIADSVGNELTGGAMLARTLILRRLLLRRILDNGEQCVGLLLPPSVAGVLANVAVTVARRVPVNLNYTVSSDVLNECIATAGIRHVLTSRKFMEKANLKVDAPLVYLEDFRTESTLWDKVNCGVAAYLVPAGLLAWRLGLRGV